MEQKIGNIVFYKFDGEEKGMVQACIFYKDGTVKNVSYEDGIEASKNIIKEEKIKSTEELSKVVNDKRIYVMSGKQFEEKFQTFIWKKEQPSNKNNDNNKKEEEQKEKNTNNTEKKNKDNSKQEENKNKDESKQEEDNKNKDDSNEEENIWSKSRKENIFTRLKNKIKNIEPIRRIRLLVENFFNGKGNYTCEKRKTLFGIIKNNQQKDEKDSKEKLVDEHVENLAKNPTTSEAPKVYAKA